MSRPISQMMEISEEQLRNSNLGAEIFVLALSNIPSIGLKGVATSDSYFFSADKLEKNADGSNNVQNILNEINTQVETVPCVHGPNGSTTGAVSSNEFVNGTGGFTYPQVGLVTIKDGSNTYTAPIKAADDGSNLLSYEFKAIPEGTYIVTARLYYHHPEDAAGVMREYSKIWSAEQPIEEYTVEVRASSQDTSFTQTIKLPITLKINGEVCAES
ncbi:MAG: hypothetical protein HGA19_00730 [Oscillochloris sp.]|nr:hypothetical protein [Oscillochloris sp.]